MLTFNQVSYKQGVTSGYLEWLKKAVFKITLCYAGMFQFLWNIYVPYLNRTYFWESNRKSLRSFKVNELFVWNQAHVGSYFSRRMVPTIFPWFFPQAILIPIGPLSLPHSYLCRFPLADYYFTYIRKSNQVSLKICLINYIYSVQRNGFGLIWGQSENFHLRQPFSRTVCT